MVGGSVTQHSRKICQANFNCATTQTADKTTAIQHKNTHTTWKHHAQTAKENTCTQTNWPQDKFTTRDVTQCMQAVFYRAARNNSADSLHQEHKCNKLPKTNSYQMSFEYWIREELVADLTRLSPTQPKRELWLVNKWISEWLNGEGHLSSLMPHGGMRVGVGHPRAFVSLYGIHIRQLLVDASSRLSLA